MQRLIAFLHGVREFRSDMTMSLEDAGLQEEYDLGREWAHRLTFRYWDQS